MKVSFLFFAVTLCFPASAQTTTTYFDFYWKKCKPEDATYFSIKKKTDSGWLQTDYYVRTGSLQMSALYSDEAGKINHGDVAYYYANGRPSKIGRMLNDKQEGICLSFHPNGMIADSALFKNGVVVDKQFQWYENGIMSDSIARINDSTFVHVSWFEDGRLGHAGYMVNEKRHGRWKYFHRNGQISAIQTFSAGHGLKSEYFDEQGSPLVDTSLVNRDADFPGGQRAWIKYLNKRLDWPKGLALTMPSSVTVGIDFLVNVDGEVIDAEVYMPFHDAFDNIALDVIRRSPKWIPAIWNNRKVRYRLRQPITFTQPM